MLERACGSSGGSGPYPRKSGFEPRIDVPYRIVTFGSLILLLLLAAGCRPAAPGAEVSSAASTPQGLSTLVATRQPATATLAPTFTPAATAPVEPVLAARTTAPPLPSPTASSVPPTATPVPASPTAPLLTVELNAATPAGAPAATAVAAEWTAGGEHLYEAQRAVLNPAANYTIPWQALPHYQIRATLQPPHIAGELALDFPNTTGTTLESVMLRLFPNGRPLYQGQISVGEVRVEGAPVEPVLSADGTGLQIPLPEPLPAGERTTLELDFTTTVGGPGAGYGILNQAGGVVTLGSWFPLLALHDGNWQTPSIPTVGDAVSSPTALFTLELDAPSDLDIASTGETLERQAQGAMTHWRIASGPARDLALVASGLWSPLTAEVDGVEVRYFPAPNTGNAAIPAQEALQWTANALRVYAQTFGPYPYRQLDVVEANVPIGGYEYPGLILFDSRHRVTGNRDLTRYLLTHELGHQWFYSLVGNNVTAEPWLDESLATYAALLATEAMYGPDAAEAQRMGWEREYAADLARTPVGINRSVFEFRNWREYRGPVYYAGALMLEELRRELGDDVFFAGLRDYVKDRAYGRATTGDLQGAFERAAGRPLTDFFQRWLAP